MKTCSRCSADKDEDDFHRDRARTDGRQPWCKACERERDRARPRHRQSAMRVLRTRANNRAMAQLRDRHREEFTALYDNELAAAIEQAELFQAATPSLRRPPADEDNRHPHPDPPTPLLKPGPAVPSEPLEERLRTETTPTGCPVCTARHRRGHVCTACGARPQVAVVVPPAREGGPPRLIRSPS